MMVEDLEVWFRRSILCWWKEKAEQHLGECKVSILKCWVEWNIYTRKSRKQQRALIIENILDVFKTSQCLQRTPSQIYWLKEMCKEFEFTGDIPQYALANLCQNMELEEAGDDEILFLQGERSGKNGKYFMQLAGKTEMYAVVDPKLETSLLQECTRDKRKAMTSEEIREILGILIKTQEFGAFGEMALITGEPRTTSVIVTGKALMVTCSRKAYREYLLPHHAEKMELSHKIRFLRGLSMLQSWGWSQISRLAFDLQVTELKHKDLVVKEGSRVNNVALIREGEASLEKEIADGPAISQGSITRMPSSQSYTTVQVAMLRSGTLIGDIEATNHTHTYLFSARVTSGSGMMVYMIPVAKFRTHFIKLHEGTKNFIQESVSARKQRYEDRLQQAKSSRQTLWAVRASITKGAKLPDTFEKEFEKQGHDLEQLPSTARNAAESDDPPLRRSSSQKSLAPPLIKLNLRRSKSSVVLLDHLMPETAGVRRKRRDRTCASTASEDRQSLVKADFALQGARDDIRMRASTWEGSEDYSESRPPLIQNAQPRIRSCGPFLLPAAQAQAQKARPSFASSIANSAEPSRNNSFYQKRPSQNLKKPPKSGGLGTQYTPRHSHGSQGIGQKVHVADVKKLTDELQSLQEIGFGFGQDILRSQQQDSKLASLTQSSQHSLRHLQMDGKENKGAKPRFQSKNGNSQALSLQQSDENKESSRHYHLNLLKDLEITHDPVPNQAWWMVHKEKAQPTLSGKPFSSRGGEGESSNSSRVRSSLSEKGDSALPQMRSSLSRGGGNKRASTMAKQPAAEVITSLAKQGKPKANATATQQDSKPVRRSDTKIIHKKWISLIR